MTLRRLRLAAMIALVGSNLLLVYLNHGLLAELRASHDALTSAGETLDAAHAAMHAAEIALRACQADGRLPAPVLRFVEP